MPPLDAVTGPALPSDLLAIKRATRAAMKRALAALSDDERRRAGESVASHLAPFLDEVCARRPGAAVALFASLPHELPTRALDELLRRRGVPRAVPTLVAGELLFRRVDAKTALQQLPPDRFGIPTPAESAPEVDLAACALILVPGLAFDDEGRRIGYGKGYYDRALRRARATGSAPLAVALLLDDQRTDRVPAGPDDERVDGLCAPALGLRLLAP